MTMPRPIGQWPKPSLEDCWRSCTANMEAAARQLGPLRAQYDRLPPGDPELTVTLHKVSRLLAERRHWKALAEWYRQKIYAQPAPDRRQAREPGSDDE